MTELIDVRKTVLNCTRCILYKSIRNYVFGEGSLNAEIMFIGEAPGANEDKEGKPFVGRAGKILDEMLKSINLKREDIYICNVLKCRPPNNRNPDPEEIKSCTPYLNAQIDLIKPKIICPLGNFATSFVLKKFGLDSKIEGISKIHGKVFKATNLFGTTIIIPFYHPAVATYNPYMIKALLEDMKVLKTKEW